MSFLAKKVMGHKSPSESNMQTSSDRIDRFASGMFIGEFVMLKIPTKSRILVN